MENNFLANIFIKTQERVAILTPMYDDLLAQAQQSRKPHAFLSMFSEARLFNCVIAEIKFNSPALKKRSQHENPVEIAGQYMSNGACALSILTEPYYFNGSTDFLKKIRQLFPDARLLMKDFIIDEVQLFQARIDGADAILLIAALLSAEQLKELHEKALLLGLTPLVEVHTQDELEIAESIGAQLIGVNNRNLKTLTVDLSVSSHLIQYKKSQAIFISASGIELGSQMRDLRKLGYQGFLIGSHLMKHEFPGEALRRLLIEESA